MIKIDSKIKAGAKLAGTLGLAAILSACMGGRSNTPQPTITDIASDDDRFDSLQLALETTGLDEALDDRNATFTVFAPTDDAFAALGDTLTTLLGQPEALSKILQYHVLAGAEVTDIEAIGLAGTTQQTLNGANFAITYQGDKLFINNAQVIDTNISAANGIIHVLDVVITPPEPTVFDGTIAEAVIANDGDADGALGTLLTAVQNADAAILDALSDPNAELTVFAPLNSAFAKIDSDSLTALINDKPELTKVLQYHVLSGSVDSITAISKAGQSVPTLSGDEINVSFTDGKLFINNAEVVTKDIVTDNGTVHLIDSVLLPPLGNIVDVAAADGRFTKLVAAVQAAGLVDTLADPDAQFTVFAPTDDAFDALGDGVAESLINGNQEALANILRYHVIGGAAINSATAAAAGGTTLQTANGQDVSVTVVDGPRIFINQSEVIVADVPASNGIIHVIDKVIVPPGTIYQEAVNAGIFTTLSQALVSAGVDPAIANEQATQTVLSATGLDVIVDDPDETLTIFVPTAAAFAALGNDTLASLAQNPNQLRDILLYHTVRGAKIEAADAIAAAGTDLTMADGNTARVSVVDGKVLIKDATVVQANVQASNGIIHFIDKVILP